MRRNILITGASSGLGEEMARQFAAKGTVPGVRAMVAAIEAEKAKAFAPTWPWVLMARLLKYAPLPLLKRVV